jgi:hypothetical protein
MSDAIDIMNVDERSIEKLRKSAASVSPEASERVLDQYCKANTRQGETQYQAYARMLREDDPVVVAITAGHDAAFRARANHNQS